MFIKKLRSSLKDCKKLLITFSLIENDCVRTAHTPIGYIRLNQWLIYKRFLSRKEEQTPLIIKRYINDILFTHQFDMHFISFDV